MPSKIIAKGACSASVSPQKQQKNRGLRAHSQQGVSLIELMVGISIGLLVVAVAVGALMVSRGISGTVSDASSIQQQAAYAMRTIGLQLRQSGSLRLNLNPGTAAAADPYLVNVAFETDVAPGAHPAMTSFMPKTDTLIGTASPVTLTVGYRRYTEPTFTGATEQSQSRNCMGGPADTSIHQRLESTFELNASALRCSGNGEAAQPIVQNVANFQVRYLLQDNTTTAGVSTIRSVDASGVGAANWGQVQAVEVCLVLYGDEAIGMATDGTSTYTDCDGTTQVDMNALTGERARRMHVAFRNVFQLRSQGLIGSVI